MVPRLQITDVVNTRTCLNKRRMKERVWLRSFTIFIFVDKKGMRLYLTTANGKSDLKSHMVQFCMCFGMSLKLF